MATKKTFFSYSRTDSDFVLKLAKDLRDASVVIWLDQLDIKGGSHWDAAIETALNSAPNVIVVLSPESVKSNNVMDEVSFALESGKTVIPVLLYECTVPFRLRRLQRIDFTGNYQTGLIQLLEVLRQTIASDSSNSLNIGPDETGKGVNEIKKETAVSSYQPSPTATNERLHKEATEQYSKKLETIKNNDEDKVPLSEKVRPGNEPGQLMATKPPYKKYLLIGAAVVIVGLLIWAVIPPTSAKGEGDIITKVDSLGTPKEDGSANTSEPITAPKDLKIGDEFQGGYVFYIDDAGEHGLIAAPEDYDVKSKSEDGDIFCKALETEIAGYKTGGFADWRLPTIKELRLLYEKSDSIPDLHLTSTPDDNERNGYYTSSPDANCMATTIGFQTGKEYTADVMSRTLNFRLVRSF